MLGASLAVFVVLGQFTAADTEALVARLGSPRYAEREEASATLERLGRQAIPALRGARSARDPEIRTRAAALFSKIEGTLLTQPTLVTLDFEDQSLPDVVRALSEQTGIKLGLIPENLPSWATRRISLHEEAPLPFWKAMDRLCLAAQLQHNFGTHGFANSNREPVFPLLNGGPGLAVPTSDSGPFRVSLQSLHYQRDVTFSRNVGAGGHRIPMPPLPLPPGGAAFATPEPPAVSEQFYAQLQVAAEPRLSVSQNGPLKLTEVLDDRGQSLRLDAEDGPVTHRVSGYFGLTTGSTLQLHAPLKRPESPGQSIRTLRGVLPVMVASRKPDPLVVPLQGAVSKTFHSDDVDLSVLEIRGNPASHQTNIEIMVRPSGGPAAGVTVPGGGAPDFMIHRPDLHQQQLEVIDNQGRVIAWYQSSFDAEGSRVNLTLTPSDDSTPTEIRYYGLARAATEIRFEFSDVPMP